MCGPHLPSHVCTFSPAPGATIFWDVRASLCPLSVVLTLFLVKEPQNVMYLATDPHLKIFSSRDPPEAKFELQTFA